ncbi:MAG: hypothetical protein JSW33_00635 [bacterium]|nr:MAG: hypothetical protein JSW33_00635 [bacterium]
MRHLNSTDIQRYLEQQINSDEKISFNDHLGSCNQCRQEVENYQNIFNALGVEEKIDLPEHFTEKIVAQLTPYSSVKKKSRWGEFIFAFGGIFLAVLITFYYTGTETILLLMKDFGKMGQKVDLPIFNLNFSYLDKLQNPYLVTIVGILAVILVLERIIFNRKMVHFI